METWRHLLEEAIWQRGETLADIRANTMTKEEMDKKFDPGFGAPEGVPFTVWTENTVYFPISYDGAERVGCVSRHPDGKPTEHQGC